MTLVGTVRTNELHVLADGAGDDYQKKSYLAHK